MTRNAVVVGSRPSQTVTVLLGAWVVGGVFVDGWAHFNRPGLETFFTPWHAILYSGAAVLFGWLLLGREAARPHRRVRVLAAASIFAAGGAGDLAWHQVFGVETGIDALVSPTHLLLLLGGLLAVTTPFQQPRGGEGIDDRVAWPVVGSATLATALGAFFLLYVSPFASAAPASALRAVPEGDPGHEAAELPAVAGLAGYLVGTAVVVIPVLLLLARGRLPFGAVTLLVTTVATLSAVVTEFDQPAAPAAALLAGLAADLLVRTTRNVPDRVRLPIAGAAIPLLLWSAQLTALAITDGVRWPAELVSGVVLLAAMLGAALAALAVAWSGSGRDGLPGPASASVPGADAVLPGGPFGSGVRAVR